MVYNICSTLFWSESRNVMIVLSKLVVFGLILNNSGFLFSAAAKRNLMIIPQLKFHFYYGSAIIYFNHKSHCYTPWEILLFLFLQTKIEDIIFGSFHTLYFLSISSWVWIYLPTIDLDTIEKYSTITFGHPWKHKFIYL